MTRRRIERAAVLRTAIFTVINAVFLHPLATEDPSRVVEMFTKDNKTVQAGNFALTPTSYQNYEDYRDQNKVFSGVAANSCWLAA